MSRTKGTPAKRTGGEKKSQGATPKKPKVTKVAPQTKAAVKKVVDKGIHNMRYAPIEENLTGRTELPEKYDGPEPKPERKSKKPNPLKESTAERIERENQLKRADYEKKAQERANRDKFNSRVEHEEDYKETKKKVDRKKARKTKMSAQGKFSETLKSYRESKSAKKMSAPATPKTERKPYVKKVDPVRTTSGKRWFDITPTSEQSEVGKKPEAKVRSLHKNARIKGLVDLREMTAANMSEGEAQRLKETQGKVVDKKKAQRLIDARNKKKPTEINKKGKKMAGRPKKTQASVDAKLAKVDEAMAKNAEETKKAPTEKKPTKVKTTKVVVEETKPKTTKKRALKKTKIAKPKGLQTLEEAKAKAPTPKPVSEAKPVTVETKAETTAKKPGKISTAIGKTAPGKFATNVGKTTLGKDVKKVATKVTTKVNKTKTAKVAKFAGKLVKVGAVGAYAVSAVKGNVEKDFKEIQRLENKLSKLKGQKPKYTNMGSGKNWVSAGKGDLSDIASNLTFGLVGKTRRERMDELNKMINKRTNTGTKPETKVGKKPPLKPTAVKSTNKYRVEHGDTLSGIAAKSGMTLAELRAANPQLANKGIFRNTGVNIPKGKKVPAGGYKGPVPYKGK